MHIPGVSKKTEKKIWQSNVLTWDEFLDKFEDVDLGEYRKNRIHRHIKKSIEAFDNGEHQFFAENLPLKDHWRAYHEFKDNCCFLDIETTGLDRVNDDITVIGLYNGSKSKFFIKDVNLSDFSAEIKKYPMIVTFNGRCFDVPFIQTKFPSLTFDHFHVDLRFAMRNIGYSGGLKSIERQLGVARSDEIHGVDGFEAVRLWYKYQNGDRDALKKLIEYNKADIQNLKYLMEFSFDKLKKKEFFDHI